MDLKTQTGEIDKKKKFLVPISSISVFRYIHEEVPCIRNPLISIQLRYGLSKVPGKLLSEALTSRLLLECPRFPLVTTLILNVVLR